jgi:hypothetical protein
MHCDTESCAAPAATVLTLLRRDGSHLRDGWLLCARCADALRGGLNSSYLDGSPTYRTAEPVGEI